MKAINYNIFIKVSVLCGLMLIFTSSCKKLIEIPENPANQINQTQVFADSTNIMGAVAGVYNNIGAANYGFGTSTALLTGLSGDEIRLGQFADAATTQFYNNAILRDNYNVNQLWGKCYSNLYQINSCINGIGSTSAVSTGLKSSLVGEMKTARAFYYFNLVNNFGGVPLVLSTDYAQTASLPRASIEQVYAQIISDLKEAMAGLRTAYPSTGRARINLNVARTLLSKVYLYRGRYQESEDLATLVISSADYSLSSNLGAVFLSGSNEGIWQLPANGVFSQTSDAQNFIPYSDGVAPDYPLSGQLFDAFEPGDLRLVNWVGTADVDEDGSGNLTRYYYPAKYKNRDAETAPAEAYMVFRLGELYLIRAEARSRLGKITDALADLNLIRHRAGLSSSNVSTTAALSAAILHERQTELFCEWGNRWFDLKRSGNIDAVLGSEKSGWKTTSALFPVPQEQMALNPALTQNAGY